MSLHCQCELCPHTSLHLKYFLYCHLLHADLDALVIGTYSSVKQFFPILHSYREIPNLK
jgi:hypothetical protein